MVELLTPKQDPYWLPAKRRLVAGVTFLVAAIINPLGSITAERLALSSLPSAFSPAVQALEGVCEAGQFLACILFPGLIVATIVVLCSPSGKPFRRLLPALLGVYVSSWYVGSSLSTPQLSDEQVEHLRPTFQSLLDYKQIHGQFSNTTDMVDRKISIGTCAPITLSAEKQSDGHLQVILNMGGGIRARRVFFLLPKQIKELPSSLNSLRYSDGY